MANAKSNCFGLCDFRITHTLTSAIPIAISALFFFDFYLTSDFKSEYKFKSINWP
jgi:hypothetical protein